MITQKTKPFTTFLFLAVALYTLPFASLAQNQKNTTQIDQLRQKAWNDGKVQVIVHFVVPDIETLTAASTQFWGKDKTPETTRDRIMADTNLIKTIEYSSWKILTELQGTDFEVVTRFDYLPFITLRVSLNALALLENSSNVLGFEEDLPQKLIDPVEGTEEKTKGGEPADETQVVPMLDDTAALVGAKAAWAMGYTGAGWYVAILDTGIRKTHQFFAGKTIIEACRAKGQDGSGPGGDCPNKSWTQDGPGSAVHYSNSYKNYDSGTAVSGIAVGNYGNLAGIAKRAGIIAVKVFSKFKASYSSCGGTPCLLAWFSDTVAGLDYVYSLRGTYNIASVNMGLSGKRYYSPCNSDSHKASIDLLRAVGIATIIATGNDTWCDSIGAPSCVSTSVAVGSSTKSDLESVFNNYHTTMQKLFAPGTNIYSPTGGSDSSYGTWNGTGLAAAHVAGAWALLKQAIPSASVTDALNALRNTGKGITSVCDGYSYPMPRLQIDKAIQSLSTFTLTIQRNNTWGTTNPAPGVHGYPINSNVQVTATPDENALFTGWTGDASGTTNPITVKMGRNKTIKANFRPNPKLTIQRNNTWGTTEPAVGVHSYPLNSNVQVTAIPATYACFTGWTGGTTGTNNPVTMVMNQDKTITANFQHIYAPVASGERVPNQSFSKTEYIDILSWTGNAGNSSLTITHYKIYEMLGEKTRELLVTLDAADSQYLRRNAGIEATTYEIAAVTDGEREGEPATVTIAATK